MNACVQISRRALALVALPPADPEGAQARDHARSCARCARVLRDALRLLAVVDVELRPPAPAAEALRRAASAVERELASARRGPPAWALALPAIALCAVSALLAVLLRDGSGWQVSVGGLCCLAIELAAAALPVALVVGRRAAAWSAFSVAAVAAAGALVGQVCLDWGCSAHGPGHLLAFHVSGVALAALAGGAWPRLARRLGTA